MKNVENESLKTKKLFTPLTSATSATSFNNIVANLYYDTIYPQYPLHVYDNIYIPYIHDVMLIMSELFNLRNSVQ